MTDVPPVLPLEGKEEEVREGKGVKFFTTNKLLARLPNNFKQFKQLKEMKSDKYDIFCISIIKSLKKFTTI